MDDTVKRLKKEYLNDMTNSNYISALESTYAHIADIRIEDTLMVDTGIITDVMPSSVHSIMEKKDICTWIIIGIYGYIIHNSVLEGIKKGEQIIQ